jgi:hypothetical protein
VGAERLEGLVGCGERRLRVADRRVGDLDERLARGGVLNRQRSAALGVAPLATDVQARLDALENLPLGGAVDRCTHALTVSVPSSSLIATSVE